MKAPYICHISRTRVVFGLAPGTVLQEATLAYRLIVAGEIPVAGESRDFMKLSGAWAALSGAETVAEFMRSSIDTRRLEVTLVEVASGNVVRSTIYNPQEADVLRAGAWKRRIEAL
jgi:hypothetical protein